MAPKKGETQSCNVFVMDKEFGWRPAIQEKVSGDKATVTLLQFNNETDMQCKQTAKKGETITVKLSDYPNGVLPLQNVDANGNLVAFSDMVKLPYLHEVRF
jgi:hypothetical protein